MPARDFSGRFSDWPTTVLILFAVVLFINVIG
ncbi:hypothetical protein HNR12_005491 [Streptomonospora nanhaiensis]|uniref:Uncharacterized protein n=1 Tax=Streptomonospora nanhaiensis TaxID=1323731 RepID=A0A853BVZ2_9ACTN|nr:hypothetical protein [Streptomonospora nanhaiensis]